MVRNYVQKTQRGATNDRIVTIRCYEDGLQSEECCIRI